MSAIVDRYARLQEAVGPVKGNLHSRAEKKKGDKPATANQKQSRMECTLNVRSAKWNTLPKTVLKYEKH